MINLIKNVFKFLSGNYTIIFPLMTVIMMLVKICIDEIYKINFAEYFNMPKYYFKKNFNESIHMAIMLTLTIVSFVYVEYVLAELYINSDKIWLKILYILYILIIKFVATIIPIMYIFDSICFKKIKITTILIFEAIISLVLFLCILVYVKFDFKELRLPFQVYSALFLLIYFSIAIIAIFLCFYNKPENMKSFEIYNIDKKNYALITRYNSSLVLVSCKINKNEINLRLCDKLIYNSKGNIKFKYIRFKNVKID